MYLDDVIIFGSSFSEHLERLKTVLTRLKEAGLTLKFSKYQWAKSEVKFLGHLITDKGIKPDPSKTEAVQNFPVPTSKTEVRVLLGLCSYYRRFIKNFASVAKPLTILTRPRSNPNFKWSKEAQEDFDYLKSASLERIYDLQFMYIIWFLVVYLMYFMKPVKETIFSSKIHKAFFANIRNNCVFSVIKNKQYSYAIRVWALSS